MQHGWREVAVGDGKDEENVGCEILRPLPSLSPQLRLMTPPDWVGKVTLDIMSSVTIMFIPSAGNLQTAKVSCGAAGRSLGLD